MKRFFALTMTLCTLLFAACEEGGKTTDPESRAKLTRTSAAIMEFDAAGGEGEITYTIENPENGVQVRAQCAAEWIDGLTTGEKVTFIVEENTTDESRLATIEVTYGDDCQFEVTINQKATDGNGNTGGGNGDNTTITMSYITGEYYGTQFSGSTYNYFVALHKEPLDEDGHVQGVALVLDLYSSTSGEATNFTVPNGTYTFDSQATMASGTIADGYSYYTNENVEVLNIKNATVEVSNNKIEAWVELTNGESVHVVYEGSLVCYNSSEESGGGDGDYYYYSNLTEDYSFSVSGGNAYGYADFYGDFYGLGVNNFYLDLYEEGESGSGLNIILDLLTDATATDFVGTYTPNYTSESDTYTFIEGYVDDEGYLVGSWIVTLEDEYISESEPFAPLTFGSVTIAATGEEGVYAVTLDCTDDLGHNISGTFTSELEINDESGYSAAPKKVQKKTANLTQKAIKKVGKKHCIVRR